MTGICTALPDIGIDPLKGPVKLGSSRRRMSALASPLILSVWGPENSDRK